MVGLGGLEPPTSPLSGVRSNQAELQTRLLRTGILAFISSGIKTIKKRSDVLINNLNKVDAHHN